MPSAVVTVTLPVVPVAGAGTVSEVAVALITVVAIPLNLTVLLDGLVAKLVPLMVTTVLAGPVTGLIEVTAGGTGIKTGGVLFLQPAKNNKQVITAKDKQVYFFIL